MHTTDTDGNGLTEHSISATVKTVDSIRQLREELKLSRQQACFEYEQDTRMRLSQQCLALWEAETPTNSWRFPLYVEWLQKKITKPSPSTE